MGDRLLGGVFCAVLLLSFAVQIAGATRAAAAMISPDPLSIVCSSPGDGTHGPPKADHSRPCPCGDLCGAGVHVPPPSRPADLSGIPIRFADRIEMAVDHAAPPTALAPARTYEARGPPPLST